MKIERTNLLIYVFNIIFLIIGLTLLLWLQARFVNDLEASIKNVKSLFSKEDIIKGPEDIRIRFRDIENLVKRNEQSAYLKRVYVSKLVQGKGEHIIHPFYFPALYPDWKAKFQELRKEPLAEAVGKYGYLYFDLDLRGINMVKAAIFSFAGLLVVAIVVFLIRLRTQEKVISRTTVELEEKRRELISLERQALAGQLTANIIHDLKKPVLNVKHELSALDKDKAAEIMPAPMVRGIQQQLDLFLSVLREINLERFIRAKDDTPEYVDVNELLDRSCNLVKYERGNVKIEKEYQAGLPPVLAHPYRLIQVFSNIILNAYQAMDGKGVLTLYTSKTNNKIVIAIKDNGPGIGPQHMGQLFTPFFSTKSRDESAGLGLYICKNIIEEMGGEIKVASELNKGTNFTIFLNQ